MSAGARADGNERRPLAASDEPSGGRQVTALPAANEAVQATPQLMPEGVLVTVPGLPRVTDSLTVDAPRSPANRCAKRRTWSAAAAKLRASQR